MTPGRVRWNTGGNAEPLPHLIPGGRGTHSMKRVQASWIVTGERQTTNRGMRFFAQPKVYFNDGTKRELLVHNGESPEEAKSLAQAELEQYILQHA